MDTTFKVAMHRCIATPICRFDVCQQIEQLERAIVQTKHTELQRKMGKKLYVGGLAWAINDDTLYQTFEVHGQIEEAKVITDRDSGRSRGFGFVTYVNEEDATKAIEALDGTELEGRYIKVNEARERAPRGGGGGNRGGGGYRGGGGNRW